MLGGMLILSTYETLRTELAEENFPRRAPPRRASASPRPRTNRTSALCAPERGHLTTRRSRVGVLLRVYAGCTDGHEHMWNGRIEDALEDGD